LQTKGSKNPRFNTRQQSKMHATTTLFSAVSQNRQQKVYGTIHPIDTRFTGWGNCEEFVKNNYRIWQICECC
jgi:hypothetical protein